MPSKCLPGGNCFQALLDKVKKIMKKMGAPSSFDDILDGIIEVIACP